MRRHKAQHVVGLKLDRLFRDAADALVQTRAWDRAGVALHLCDMGGGAVDTSSPMGRMLLTMLSGFAEFERAMIAERTSIAIRHKRDRGEYIGGQAPYGYELVDRRLSPIASEQAVITEARRLKAAGMSLRAIAAELTRAGYATRNGSTFAASQVQRMVA
jgi:DNA invertase Pin-like site-specific DNA recombinase